MAERTIGDQQAEFDQWYGEWLNWRGSGFGDKTAESLLSFFKLRLTFTLGPIEGEA